MKGSSNSRKIVAIIIALAIAFVGKSDLREKNDNTKQNKTIFLLRDAPLAFWQSGILSADGNTGVNNKNLIWNGADNNPDGFAREDNVVMEDGRTYYCLRTHPMWLPHGTIKGFFPWRTLAGKKAFRAKVGFLQNGKSIDGVTFQVWVHYRSAGNQENWVRIAAFHKVYSSSLSNILVDFPRDLPNTFRMELRVDAGNSSNYDWAAWVDPQVIVTQQGQIID